MSDTCNSAHSRGTLWHLCQSDIVLKKEPRSYPMWRTTVSDILEQQQQNMWISQKERSRGRVSAVYGAKKRGTERQRLSFLDVKKARARRAEHVLLHMTWQRKGKAKGRRTRSLVQRDNPAERQYARKSGKVHLEKKIVLRVSTAKEEIVVTTGCDHWPPPHLDDKDYFKVFADARLKVEKEIALALPCIKRGEQSRETC